MRTTLSLPQRLLAGMGAAVVTATALVPASALAAPALPSVVINEVIQNNDQIADAIELLNTGSTAIDISGWILADDKNSMTINPGTMLQPGQFLAITTDDDSRDDKFGLGKADEANVFLPDGTLIDRFAWEGHQPTSYGRCPDGTGAFGVTVAATPNQPNACTPSAAGNVVINEVESSAATGGDWVELFNNGTLAIDLGGLTLTDSNPKNSYQIPAGTVIEPGGFFLIAESEFGFGLGGADAVTLLDGDTQVDTYAWETHSPQTYGRCPDGVGPFAATVSPTPGAANDCATVETPHVVVNEVETSDGNPGDWIELFNLEDEPVDLSGWVVRDNDDAHTSVLPEGSVIAPGGFFVVNESQLGFGLGKEDSARIYLPGGHTLVDEYAWQATAADTHAPTTFGRCPDGTGPWQITTASTKGAPNDCGLAIRINELSSNGDAVGDWVELVNAGFDSVDLSGLQLVDSSGKGAVTIPAGTTLAAGGYLQVYVYETFGLGGKDNVQLLAPDNEILDEVSWDSHVLPSLGRCPDGTGPFTATRAATPGASNACEGDLITSPWPGTDAMTPADQAKYFGADMSGAVFDADGTVWAVNNGLGSLHKLVLTNGQVTEAEGWTGGRTLRYPDGTGTVDAEGVALIGGTAANGVLVASERNTGPGDRGSRPSVLRYDLAGSGDLVATHEWNLAEFYPGIGANAGLEGIAWISDAALTSQGLVDSRTGQAYAPAALPAHGGGLVFVGVEATNKVAGYALTDSGQILKVTEFESVFPGVMELEYDADLEQLWVICDDACEGRSQVFELGADTQVPGIFAPVAVYERPAGTQNYANEGFAIAPLAQCTDGTRQVIWADDATADGHAFRVGALNCSGGGDGGNGGNTDGDNTDGGTTDGGGTDGDNTDAGGANGNTDAGANTDGEGDGNLAATGANSAVILTVLASVLAFVALGGGLMLLRKRI